MESPLNKLDVIEYFEDKGHSLRVGELLEKQIDIYKNRGVALPILHHHVEPRMQDISFYIRYNIRYYYNCIINKSAL